MQGGMLPGMGMQGYGGMLPGMGGMQGYGGMAAGGASQGMQAVSYNHLTLPTNREGYY